MRRRQIKKIRGRTVALVRFGRSPSGKVRYRPQTERRATRAYVYRKHRRMPTAEDLNLRCSCGRTPKRSVLYQWRIRCRCGRKTALWLLPENAFLQWAGIDQERNGEIEKGMVNP